MDGKNLVRNTKYTAVNLLEFCQRRRLDGRENRRPGQIPVEAFAVDVDPVTVDIAATEGSSELHVRARLRYRKVEQYLIDFLMPDSGMTAKITDMSTAEAVIVVSPN